MLRRSPECSPATPIRKAAAYPLVLLMYLLFSASLAGCGDDSPPDENPIPVPNEREAPHAARARLDFALAEKNESVFARELRGDETSQSVLRAVFAVSADVIRLKDAVERRFGPNSMIYEEEEASTRSLPGMPREVGGGDPEPEKLSVVNDRVPLRTNLWDRDLMFMLEGNRWVVDARASLETSGLANFEAGAAVMIRHMGQYREAVAKAQKAIDEATQTREQVLATLLNDIAMADVRALREYRAIRTKPATPVNGQRD